ASILLIPKFLERKRYIRKLIASTFKSDNSIHSTYTVRKNLENISLKRNLYNILRLGTYLAGFRGYSNMIKSKLSIPSLNVFKQFLVAADKTGDRIAEIIVRGDNNIDLTEFNRYLENINQKSKLNKYKDLKAAATIANDMGGIFNNVNRLLKDESKNLSNFKLHKPSNPLKQIIKANFNLENMYMRHTIRFTIAMTIGLALVHITKSRAALWIIMGILIVLKPDITSTINNMLLRVSFNLLGVILAVILGFLFPHFLLVWLAFIMIFLFRAFLPYYIGPSVMAMTIFIVLLWPHGTIIDNGIARLIDITLGALIALILAYIIFPNRITVDLPLQLAKTFMANSKYGKNVFVSSFSNYDHNRAVSGFNNLILEYNNLQSGIKKLQDSFIDVSEDVKFYNNISTLNYQLSGNISIIATKLELKEYEGPELSLLSNFLQDTMQNMAKAIKGNLKLKIIDENKQNLIKDKLINYEDNNSQYMKQYIHWIIEDVNFLHQIVKEGIESGLFNKYKKLY
ncbi:MAG: FUSC family protein, partial [Methanomicrobiales archaeon]